MVLTACSYYGGKSRTEIRQWIGQYIPYDWKSIYCEPFAGMCGMLLHRKPVATEIVNDLDGDIVAFWSVIMDKDKYRALKWMVNYTLHAEEMFWRAKNMLKEHTYKDDIEQAWAVYCVLQHGVAHGLGSGGWATRAKTRQFKNGGHSFAKKIEALHLRMRDVQVTNRCAIVFLSRMATYKEVVIYADPPYRTANTSTYGTDAIDIDALTDVFRAQKGKVVISGYNDEWDHLGWHKVNNDFVFKPFGTNAVKGQALEVRTECLWLNHTPQGQQALF